MTVSAIRLWYIPYLLDCKMSLPILRFLIQGVVLYTEKKHKHNNNKPIHNRVMNIESPCTLEFIRH